MVSCILFFFKSTLMTLTSTMSPTLTTSSGCLMNFLFVIWDMESIGDIATVTVHIKKIREKVEVDTSNPQYIETIWGVGYRFKV